MNSLSIRLATIHDAEAVAEMADALLHEIMEVIGVQAFDSDPEAMKQQLLNSIPNENHFVLLAEKEGAVVGFAALCSAYSLYTKGPFGLMTELFVRSEYRSQSIGNQLLDECQAFAKDRGWMQLEVTTPPLPEFERTLQFYQDNGFVITGGRKLKRLT